MFLHRVFSTAHHTVDTAPISHLIYRELMIPSPAPSSIVSSSMGDGEQQNSTTAAGMPNEGSTATTTKWWQSLRWRQTSPAEAAAAERGMLALIKTRVTARDVCVGPGPEDTMRTLEAGAAATGAGAGASPTAATAAADAAAPPVVLLPGYGAGALFFWRNIDGLAARLPQLYAVDWLGTGRSGRPPFTARGTEEAEAFFLDALAAWREREGLGDRKMVLVGHSLGGYLAAAYALRHPDHVQHLVLVCPAGVPEKPEGWEQRFTALPALRRLAFRAAASAWEAGVTPGAVVRGLGPAGPRLIGRYVSARFAMHGTPLTAREEAAFSPYFYSIAASRGSGEFALRHLLSPGAWARAPMAARLRELPPSVPISMIYGESDWMDPRHAVALAAELDKLRPRAVPSDHRVEVIPDAGHYVCIEQPEAFNAALLRAIAPWLPRSAHDGASSGSSTPSTSTSSSGSDKGGGDAAPAM